MSELIKKQKRLKKLSHLFLVAMAVLILVYIGIEPYLLKTFGNVSPFHITLFFFVLLSLSVFFIYQSKYKKLEDYLEKTSDIINDAGFYLTSREEKDIESYSDSVIKDAAETGYKAEYNKEINDFTFSAVLSKQREFIYLISESDIDKNDMIAYLDSAVYDMTAVKLKRKGDAVIMFICDSADESAISYAKERLALQTTRRSFIHFAYAICEVKSKRVYFLGNRADKCQQIIANYAMNCDVPIKDKFIVKEKLEYQKELEKELEGADLNSVKNKIDERL